MIIPHHVVMRYLSATTGGLIAVQPPSWREDLRSTTPQMAIEKSGAPTEDAPNLVMIIDSDDHPNDLLNWATRHHRQQPHR